MLALPGLPFVGAGENYFFMETSKSCANSGFDLWRVEVVFK
jgi:hypothetical protein